ncbi:hypothetical protein DPMN_150441 [Dreissena polymorpha]|uniref:Uncharacterized protein n=1 Tax=Dreissena polymorpha TaxID=45954 RepID=A0A9D4J5M6_DREPO|nr:hypothetical protein DPMN_150441 [Dreissena polymorpha]
MTQKWVWRVELIKHDAYGGRRTSDELAMTIAQCLQTKCRRTDSGQRPILKPHLSSQCSITMKTAPTPWQLYIYKTNLFTKFHDDWAKNKTDGRHVIQLTGTIFQLNSLFTCFHYIHIEKNDPPIGGHVFSPIWTIFELVRHINKSCQRTARSTTRVLGSIT